MISTVIRIIPSQPDSKTHLREIKEKPRNGFLNLRLFIRFCYLLLYTCMRLKLNYLGLFGVCLFLFFFNILLITDRLWIMILASKQDGNTESLLWWISQSNAGRWKGN